MSNSWDPSEVGFENENVLESYLCHRYRHDPLAVPSYLTKVDKHPDYVGDDDRVLQQLYRTQSPWMKYIEDRMYDVESTVKRAVALQFRVQLYFWEDFKKQCEALNDLESFDRAIKVSAKLIYMLYSKDGRQSDMQRQMIPLWDHLSILGREGASLAEAYKEIDKLVTNIDKYYLVTDTDIVDLLMDYAHGRCQHGFYDEVEVLAREEVYLREREGVLGYIEKVVQMEPLPTTKLEDDEVTCFMMKLFRDSSRYHDDFVDKLVADNNVMGRPVSEYSDCEELLICHMYYFVNIAMDDIKDKFTTMLLFMKYYLFNLDCIAVPSRICEIVEVAHLRRMVLGSRFISRDHLIWAFYECGFGLPPSIWKKIKLDSADEEHLFYHIYVAAQKLAESFGETTMRLEHFIFAVLYSDAIGVDWDNVSELRKLFEKFLKDVDLKRSAENLGSSLRDIEEDIAPSKRSKIYGFL